MPMFQEFNEQNTGNESQERSIQVEIVNYVAVLGPSDASVTVVAANSSAALTEGISGGDKRLYDEADSGSQMLCFCPPGATLPLAFPGEKLTEDNVGIAYEMYELAADSLTAVGMQVDVTLVPTANIHDYVAGLGEDIRIVPLFASPRLAENLSGEAPLTHAAAHVNNKSNFIRLLQQQGLGSYLPTSYLYDTQTYPDTGFPTVEELRAANTSGMVFYKEDVSAGGHGVEGVRVDDPDFELIHGRWVNRMQEARARGSQEGDFHIQQGIDVGEGTPESPCITGVIHPDGNIQLLQVALQKLEGGTNHIGNIVDPVYEQAFFAQHGSVVIDVFRALASVGLQGHAGVDVIFDRHGQMFLIEDNPRLNGNSRVRRLRDHLPDGVHIGTNNTPVLTAQNRQNVQALRQFFYDSGNPNAPAVAITRFPRYYGDSFGLDFINDQGGELEQQVMALLAA